MLKKGAGKLGFSPFEEEKKGKEEGKQVNYWLGKKGGEITKN